MEKTNSYKYDLLPKNLKQRKSSRAKVVTFVVVRNDGNTEYKPSEEPFFEYLSVKLGRVFIEDYLTLLKLK